VDALNILANCEADRSTRRASWKTETDKSRCSWMKSRTRRSCETDSPEFSFGFARVQIGAKPISQRFPVEAQAKFAYRLHVVLIAPDPHLCRDKTDVIRPLTFQGSGTMQICAGLTSAAYLREHKCESVLRTRPNV